MAPILADQIQAIIDRTGVPVWRAASLMAINSTTLQHILAMRCAPGRQSTRRALEAFAELNRDAKTIRDLRCV